MRGHAVCDLDQYSSSCNHIMNPIMSALQLEVLNDGTEFS